MIRRNPGGNSRDKVEDSVEIGDRARLTLADDEIVEGRIAAISPAALTIELDPIAERARHPGDAISDNPSRVIAFDRIRVLEVQDGGIQGSPAITK